jgi:excinuclease UvrABC helicase subunit UvrB
VLFGGVSASRGGYKSWHQDKQLEKEMLKAAKNLGFERATELRDQLRKLRDSVLISPL